MSTDDFHPASVEPAPAPWTVKAEAWWFITSLGRKPEPGEALPLSYFPSQETQLYKISTEQDAFRGGRGSITLTCYAESPIGAFDELAIAPGEFVNPYESQSHRVTRAYVSSLKAVVSGRHNWGLPRELAQFVYLPSLDIPDATEVRVYPATSFSPIVYSPTACFAALIKPVPWLPSIPASLSHFPQVKLCQPPLDASPDAAVDGLVGASKWHMLECSQADGRAKPFRCEGLFLSKDDTPGTDAKRAKKFAMKKLADGVGFPDVEPYSFGIHWTEITMTLPQAVPLASL
ncbi:hypothetical protein C8Q79DRAFT_914134 [Trametes meyenii]|nr:hypothetical protein C8Q79DRAFT_914134 [Trametes meyenii]